MRCHVLQQGSLFILPMLIVPNWPPGSVENKVNLHVEQQYLSVFSITINTCYHWKPFYWRTRYDTWLYIIAVKNACKMCQPLTWFRYCLNDLLNLLKSLCMEQEYFGGLLLSILNYYLKHFWWLHLKSRCPVNSFSSVWLYTVFQSFFPLHVWDSYSFPVSSTAFANYSSRNTSLS